MIKRLFNIILVFVVTFLYRYTIYWWKLVRNFTFEIYR